MLPSNPLRDPLAIASDKGQTLCITQIPSSLALVVGRKAFELIRTSRFHGANGRGLTWLKFCWAEKEGFQDFAQVKEHPFRLERQGALAYYRGMDDDYPEEGPGLSARAVVHDFRTRVGRSAPGPAARPSLDWFLRRGSASRISP